MTGTTVPDVCALRDCQCRPGRQCIGCRFVARARLRMVDVASSPISRVRQPVESTDRQTSTNDCRAALCLALGVPADRIDPASGRDLGGELWNG